MAISDAYLLKIAGTVAVSATVAGFMIIYAKKLISDCIERDQITNKLEMLRADIDQLRHEVLSLKEANGTTISSKEKIVNCTAKGKSDIGFHSKSSVLKKPIPRVTSYQSLTSDGEYADAEEEWYNGAVPISCIEHHADNPVLLPIASFEDIDKLFGTDNVRSGYDMLREHYNGKEKSPDLLWRLAKFCHELAGRTTDKEKKKELILEGRDYAVEGHHLDEDHFNAVKWAAIMTGQSTDYLGTKEKIEQGSKFKEYLDRALLIDAKEYALLHMRGRYSYSVANLSWFEKKAAAVFYAAPPSATIEEALSDFLAAYESKPDWIENLVYIARCYLALKEKVIAKTYLSMAIKLKPVDDSENELLQEATKLVGKC